MLNSLLITFRTLLIGVAAFATTLGIRAVVVPRFPSLVDNLTAVGISRNWAGFIASGGKFTGVSGTWIVPKATGTDRLSSDAVWVGVGGLTNTDLIQTGTQDIIAPNGQTDASAFYEMLPGNSRPLSVDIHPGDSVTASVNQTSSGNWTVIVKDNTTGQSATVDVSYPSSLSSAEWIVEDPSTRRSEIALDNFGSVPISAATAQKDGKTVSVSDSHARSMAMVNPGREILASPSGVGPDGTSFTVTRTSR
jgi:hypothetical protein